MSNPVPLALRGLEGALFPDLASSYRVVEERRTAMHDVPVDSGHPGSNPSCMAGRCRRGGNGPSLSVQAWTEQVSSTYAAPGIVPLRPACWPPMIESDVIAVMKDMRSRAGCGLR